MAPAPYGAFPYHSGRACFAPGRTLGLLPAGTSFATVLVRLVPGGQPPGRRAPALAAAAVPGNVRAGHRRRQRGWLDPVPDQIRRKCCAVALIRMLSFLAPDRRDPRHRPSAVLDLRVHWAPLWLAATERPLAVGAARPRVQRLRRLRPARTGADGPRPCLTRGLRPRRDQSPRPRPAPTRQLPDSRTREKPWQPTLCWGRRWGPALQGRLLLARNGGDGGCQRHPHARL